ncbi:MAG: MtrAB system accessory lipoprotein LpqB [Corynebacterium sp.]|nr:MtrAB system accessory lipoprotein LpqB [Corynebacterium sp.]
MTKAKKSTRITAQGRTPQIRAGAKSMALLAVATLGAACTTIPSDTTPQALRSVSAPTSANDNLAPKPGEDPDLLLRDFFAASAHPTQQHQAARAYLTEEASNRWNDGASTTIVDRIDVNATINATPNQNDANTVTYVVRGGVVGNLGNGGVYTPTSGNLEATFVLKKTNGEWRIDQVPSGVIIERTELRSNYTPRELFFLDPTERILVRDRRWVFNQQSNLDSALLSLLVEGPKARMRAGLLTEVPENATFAGSHDGVYYFTGFASLNADARHKFAAQVIWTLARAGITGPYRIDLDGAPLDSENPDMNVEDVAELNPNALTSGTTTLYAVRSGQLFDVQGSSADTLVPANGTLGSSRSIQSVAISGDAAAAVIGNASQGDQTMVMGPINGAVTNVMQARNIGRPTFEPSGNTAWVVVDNHTVVAVSRNNATADFAQVNVDTSSLESITNSEITAVRLSPSGTQVAFIIGGHVYIATVSRPDAGERSVTDILDVAPDIGDTALDVDWLPDGGIVVGTSNQETPLWKVEIDGSEVTRMATGNLTAPITSVSISPSTIYVTDARAALRMAINANAENSLFWREVPALAGRSGNIVASK